MSGHVCPADDRLPRAAYEAAQSLRKDRKMPYQPWETLDPYWKRLYRAIADGVVFEEIIIATEEVTTP